jgi:hypothetical protein
MGAFQEEWHNLHILPITCCFCPIYFAMTLIYYQDFKTPNITQFGAVGGQIQHMAAQKGFTLHQAQLHWKSWNQPCLSELSSEPAI